MKVRRTGMRWLRPGVVALAASLAMIGTSLPGTGGATAVAAGAPVYVASLTTERQADPIGIDAVHPRLGWVLASGVHGEAQTAYEVAVSSSADKAAQGTADVWDSGKVSTGQSVDVAYDGPALHSATRYFWRVGVWDGTGEPSPWSQVAYWETGLLDSADWNGAQWIGRPQQSTLDLQGAHWIWYPEGNPASSEPVSTRYFRRSFDVADISSVSQARVVLTGDDTADLWVNGQQLSSSPRVTDSWKQAAVVDVTGALRSGGNTLAVASTNTTVSPAGMIAKLRITYTDGSTTDIVTDGSWKASQDGPSGWQQPSYDDSAWPAALDVAPYGQGPWGSNVNVSDQQPLPYLRHGFDVTKTVARARLYISALGLYEAHINGQRVGDEYFAPGWTDYNKRVQYQTYDVTTMLHAGSNAIGALLDDGWYAGRVGFAGSHIYGQQPWLRAQLRIDYTDGTSQTVGTDGSWKVADSPVLASNIYDGEDYDAHAEQIGWDRPGFDDSSWKPAGVNDSVHPNLVAQVGPPVRIEKEIHPVKMTEPQPGHFVFDMGQNMVGWNRLTVSGPAGTKVTMRHAEVLNPDGTIYTANLRSARATDTYVLKGTDTEVFEPHFTYHGYRYVELTGFPGTPTLDSVTGLVAHADAPFIGKFDTSSQLVNQIQDNIAWGQRGNFMSVPTDCPQRDERLGWTGDINIFSATSTFNMGVDGFLGKFANDLTDAQEPNGAFTDVAPQVCCGAGTAGWGDAGVVIPWTLWQRYGDLGVVRDHYDAMTRWISYLKSTSGADLIRNQPTYGDWLNVNDGTSQGVVSTAYFAYSTELVAQMAAAIGKQADATSYQQLFQQIKDAFDAKFVSADGHVGSDSQTSYVLALSMNLLPDNLVQPAADRLVQKIADRDWHLSVGFLGVEKLLPVLTETGHLDVAYKLINQTTFPSWGYMIGKGATTVWERWDGIKPDGSFNDPSMNSFNHAGLGSVGDWMYRTIGGIQPDPQHPGYKQFEVRPQPGGGLTYANESYDSPYGQIRSDWAYADGNLVVNTTVPVNTTALVYVPAASSGDVTAPPDARFVRMDGGAAVYAVGSGRYTFVSHGAQG